MWKTIKSQIIFQNKWIKLFSDDIEFDNGKPGVYAYLHRHDGAHAIIVTPDKKIVLFKQYRYPTRTFEWSIPGGKIDEGETPETAAIREIKEELGIGVKTIKFIGTWVAQSSLNTEKLNIFVAWSSDTPQKAGLNDESISEIITVDANQALIMIDDGLINDPTISSAIQIVIRKYLSKQ